MVPRYDYWYAAHKQEEDETPRVKSEDDEGKGPYSTYPDDDEGHPSTKMGPDHPIPSSWPSSWSWPPPGYGPSTISSSLATDTPSPSSGQSAIPENTSAPSPTPTVAGSNGYPNPSATGANDNGIPYGSPKKQHSSNGAVYAAAAIVPVVLIVFGLAAFFYLRKRKRQNRFAATPAQIREMKMSNQPTVQAYVAAPPSLPREPSYTAPPSHPPPPSPTSPAPVILGPITSGSSGNYMTGIDTSDVVSVRNERTGLGDPFADGNSLNEEPPPPYRPRSIAPLSRDTSLRVPSTGPDPSSQINLIDSQGQPLRSPFDDPEDDDVVSDLSGPTARRNQDNMSVVSDLSYQQDPVVNRPTV